MRLVVDYRATPLAGYEAIPRVVTYTCETREDPRRFSCAHDRDKRLYKITTPDCRHRR
jgi:hypothetical protein